MAVQVFYVDVVEVTVCEDCFPGLLRALMIKIFRWWIESTEKRRTLVHNETSFLHATKSTEVALFP